uniref:Secreted protein n=1 Tax=Rhodosorus marinus TaxID=101924 RepID=A0A7S3EDX7_9RHOD
MTTASSSEKMFTIWFFFLLLVFRWCDLARDCSHGTCLWRVNIFQRPGSVIALDQVLVLIKLEVVAIISPPVVFQQFPLSLLVLFRRSLLQLQNELISFRSILTPGPDSVVTSGSFKRKSTIIKKSKGQNNSKE